MTLRLFGGGTTASAFARTGWAPKAVSSRPSILWAADHGDLLLPRFEEMEQVG